MHFLRIVYGLIVVMLFASAAQAHPADGYTPEELSPAYGTESMGLPPEWGIGDLTFTRPYPDPAGLTAQERYIVAGARGYGPLGERLLPWYNDVWAAVSAIYERDGSMPGMLTEELVRSVAKNPENVSQAWVDHFRSPLTNEFPRLDAAAFSPGDVYIRTLTEAEKSHFASLLGEYDHNFNRGEMLNTITGEWVRAHLAGEVYYVRVYGLTGVLHNNLHYSIFPDEPFYPK